MNTSEVRLLAKNIAADVQAVACCSCSYRCAQSQSSARGGPGIRMPRSDTLRFAITLTINPEHSMHSG